MSNKKYIYNIRYFYNLKFYTCNFVYAPKYETEYIIFLFDKIMKIDKNIKYVFDICAGTGCIGIILKKKYFFLDIVLVDKNFYAIKCIKKNLKLYNLNISFFYKNIFEFLNVCCDVVVCNPPYICSNDIDKNVSNEIYNSLNGGINGNDFILKLLFFLNDIKYIIFELGSIEQFNLIENIILKENWKCIDFIKPYTNLKICFCIFEKIKIF